MENKWENIRVAVVAFICVFGLVTCHGFDRYTEIRKTEAEAELQKYAADEARARAELYRLQKTEK